MKAKTIRASKRQCKGKADATSSAEVEEMTTVCEKIPADSELKLPLDSLGEETYGGSHAAAVNALAGRCEIVARSVQASRPKLPDFGNASVATRVSFIDAIKHVVPALADIFAQAEPETTAKPVSQRSTDELIIQIDAGKFLNEIAHLWCISTSNLNSWIAADADRFVRANHARKNQAALWDWVALQVLLHAPSDRAEIARAEKIAQHCRWRAEVFSRDDYGKKFKVTQADEHNARELTTLELKILARGGVLPG